MNDRDSAARVTCYSLGDFRSLQSSLSTAVISIRDDNQTQVVLDGWGPSLVCLFTDVEFDEEYLRIWGWELAIQAGLFSPTEARRIARFVQSEEVRPCAQIVVHCHAGESRSTAVGAYIAEFNRAQAGAHASPVPPKPDSPATPAKSGGTWRGARYCESNAAA